jgi:lipoate-protein ligase A
MAFLQAKWRVNRSAPSNGIWNMAVDEAILESVMAGKSETTLRLYAWEPACLSLGYAQPVADVDQEALNKRGLGLVRRPTGGRAILHSDELTYSVISTESDLRLAGGVLESYLIFRSRY